MDKDIRDILKNNTNNNVEISSKHRVRFQQKLLSELHEKPSKVKKYKWLYVAASIVLLVGVGIKFSTTNIEGESLPKITNSVELNNDSQISLGSISPELKTIESYYINTINYELSQLELTKENKELFDGYLTQLGLLTKEYKSLTQELNKKGINDDTINALIGNLQMRLQLLKRMQKQLHEFKNPNQNDTQTI
ncbi:hypothetical protein SAMN04487765_2438 [Tenacibaculum sp. MAR_2010_89]|uniref:hypothetical protein n=1 Tax=Tenacibaculum sp. MAR_2010_89 TaxID=1250198 RepID=UPI0008993137|nr:hypothetical protein [Tenacibaculum sp. MAR_2010_89]SEE40384.1 hypothetical protein SAMN04487765_2438 [Tenacibaculum sp. MAR_2010_89]